MFHIFGIALLFIIYQYLSFKVFHYKKRLVSQLSVYWTASLLSIWCGKIIKCELVWFLMVNIIVLQFPSLRWLLWVPTSHPIHINTARPRDYVSPYVLLFAGPTTRRVPLSSRRSPKGRFVQCNFRTLLRREHSVKLLYSHQLLQRISTYIHSWKATIVNLLLFYNVVFL